VYKPFDLVIGSGTNCSEALILMPSLTPNCSFIQTQGNAICVVQEFASLPEGCTFNYKMIMADNSLLDNNTFFDFRTSPQLSINISLSHVAVYNISLIGTMKLLP
jgi:hypothetical protein